MTLVDVQENFLCSYSEIVRRKIQKAIDKYCIKIMQYSNVTEISPTFVRVQRVDQSEASATQLPSNTIIWSTGAESHDIFVESGISADQFGFMVVTDQLHSVKHENIFGGGDCISMKSFLDQGLRFPPKAGVYAIRMAPVLSRNITRYLRKKRLTNYVPQKSFLSILNIADGEAIAINNGLAAYSMAALEWKNEIDVGFMQRFNHQQLVRCRLLYFIKYEVQAFLKIAAFNAYGMFWTYTLDYEPILIGLIFILISFSNTCVHVLYFSKRTQGITSWQNRMTTSKGIDLKHMISTYMFKIYYPIKLSIFLALIYATMCRNRYNAPYILIAEQLLTYFEIPLANAVTCFIQMGFSRIF